MRHRERFIEANRIRLHLVEAGPEKGKPVILLHGFPDFWYGWRKQIAALAAKGLRVFAPDQRGFNLSDKPRQVRGYSLRLLVEDVASLIVALGYERAHVVGHDWGGIVGWALAMEQPRRVDRLAVLNAPHPAVLRRYLRHDPEQIRRSWYVFLFQMPLVPEAILRARGYAGLARTVRGALGPSPTEQDDLEAYRRSWAQTGALTAMLNWYRAAARYSGYPPAKARIEAPTLMLWGMRDPALSHRMARPSIDYCSDGKLVLFPEATHWVQHDASDDVNELLIEFLRPKSPDG